jgi:hypothetical protein
MRYQLTVMRCDTERECFKATLVHAWKFVARKLKETERHFKTMHQIQGDGGANRQGSPQHFVCACHSIAYYIMLWFSIIHLLVNSAIRSRRYTIRIVTRVGRFRLFFLKKLVNFNFFFSFIPPWGRVTATSLHSGWNTVSWFLAQNKSLLADF